MPNISKLTMSNGVVYNIKDSQARKDIEDIKKNGSAGSGGSGGGVFVVDCTMEGQRLTAEKTAGEIFEAVESGLIVIFKLTSSPIAIYMYCLSANNMDGYKFAVALQSGNNFVVDRFTASDSSDNPVLINK